MKSKEFEKFIDSSYNNEVQAIYDNLKKKLNVPDDSVPAPAEIRNSVSPSATAKQDRQSPASKRLASFKNFFKKPARLAACVSMAVAVACLAIILPFTLNNRNDLPAVTPPSVSDDPSNQKERYCAAAACRQMELKYTLKEYSARHALSLLYVDWYDVAAIKTSMYVNKENSFDIIYYQETFEHKYTGSLVEFYITDYRTCVYELELCKRPCRNEYVAKFPESDIYLGYTKVFWGFEPVEDGEPVTYMAYFNVGNYRYLLVMRYPETENNFFELINSVLATRFPAYR